MATVVLYSEARARQLRVLLWAAVVVGALLVALAAFALVLAGPSRYVLMVTVPAVLLLATTVTALRRMEHRGPAARWWSVGTGVLLMVLGLFLTSLALGVLPSILGVLLVLMALLPDTGDH
jgi:hypothetical protein